MEAGEIDLASLRLQETLEKQGIPRTVFLLAVLKINIPSPQINNLTIPNLTKTGRST